VKILTFLILATWCFYSCNTVTERNPQPAVVPLDVVQVVKDSFPDAVDLVFKPIITEQIWDANFHSGGNRYNSVVDRSRLLFTSELLESQVPDSLRQVISQTSYAGGHFSNFRRGAMFFDGSFDFMADYEWNGMEFTVKWFFYNRPQLRYIVTISQTTLSEFYVYNTDILPKTIKDFLSTHHDTMQSGVQMYVYPNDRILYGIGSKVTDPTVHQLIFDGSGNLIYSYLGKVDFYNQLSDYPAAIRNFVANNPEYKGFDFFWGIRFEDGGKSGYRIDLVKNVKADEKIHLYFDQNGVLNDQKYQASTR
jgi:hypothetical protein